MRIKVSLFTNMGLVLFIIYAFFSDVINIVIGSARRECFLLTVILMLCFVPYLIKRRGLLRRKAFFLLLVVSIFVCCHNQAFQNGDCLNTIKWLISLILCITISETGYFLEKLVYLIANIGFIHVSATWFFYFVPSLYSHSKRFWGYWPTGTESGSLGYRAGITNHYSHNGIVLAVTLMAIYAILFMSRTFHRNNRTRTERILYSVMFALTLSAILLTTKRAHLIFAVCAMLLTYYFIYPEKLSHKTLKIIAVCAASIIALCIASEYIPEVKAFTERFTTHIGDDATMKSRFKLWNLAIGMFIESPLFGKGWYAVRYRYRSTLYSAAMRNHVRSTRYDLLDAHNVYVQILAETGIIGFLIYLFIIIQNIIETYRLLTTYMRYQLRYGEKNAVVFSFVMQIFFLLYSLTGNCLYDVTAPFYMIAVSLSSTVANRHKLYQNHHANT